MSNDESFLHSFLFSRAVSLCDIPPFSSSAQSLREYQESRGNSVGVSTSGHVSASLEELLSDDDSFDDLRSD